MFCRTYLRKSVSDWRWKQLSGCGSFRNQGGGYPLIWLLSTKKFALRQACSVLHLGVEGLSGFPSLSDFPQSENRIPRAQTVTRVAEAPKKIHVNAYALEKQLPCGIFRHFNYSLTIDTRFFQEYFKFRKVARLLFLFLHVSTLHTFVLLFWDQ